MTEKIHLRLASLEDSRHIFCWRNDPKVRRYSLNSEEIPFETHEAWFVSSLKNQHRKILMAELSGQLVGVYRVDLLDQKADVSIYLNPAYMGKKLGETLLAAGELWVREHLPFVKKLAATILFDNIASVKIFERQGFLKKQIFYEKLL